MVIAEAVFSDFAPSWFLKGPGWWCWILLFSFRITI